MSLDLEQTAVQIDRMTDDLRVRHGEKEARLARALTQTRTFDVSAYDDRRQRDSSLLRWAVPEIAGPPAASYEPPSIPANFIVAGVDGSHIDVDRHLAARCYLINLGSCVLTYGSAPNAELNSRPKLYASDEDLFIRTRNGAYQEQAVQGAVLGVKRAVEEIRGLVDVVRSLPPDVPTLGLMDGTLIMFLGRGTQDFVIDELVVRGFVRALDELRELAAERPFAVASFISLPGSFEFASALRVPACPYKVSDCGRHCGSLPSGNRPCDAVAQGVVDREVFDRTLQPGQRSPVFTSSNPLVRSSYGGHGVSFFYLNAGEEIARVEVPAWVADDEGLLGLTHSLVFDQCKRGHGYPVALQESHEQAVITTVDRRYFAEFVEASLDDRRMPVYTSEKNRSKRLRWL